MNNFWKNNRYQSFERGIGNGDLFRGEASRPFPWLLMEEERQDRDGDIWYLAISCTGLVSENNSNQFWATLTSTTYCIFSDERLESMGFSPERLEWLGISREELLSETFENKIKTKIDALDLLAKMNFEKLRKYILLSYNPETKYAKIKEKIESTPHSRFSDIPQSHRTPKSL